MIQSNNDLTPKDLLPALERMWEASGAKIRSIEETCPPEKGAPVFTVEGRYTSRGWTEWTQGFVYGSALLDFEATGDAGLLEIGKRRTLEVMAPEGGQES